MTVDRGQWTLLEAQPGKGDVLAEFLRECHGLAASETGTVAWLALRLSETTFGLLATFQGEPARRVHLAGAIPAGIAHAAGELLAGEPDSRPVDILGAT
ncbi:hypothetical protein SAMN05443575_2173 [Jatrophihabitans endophyticus]|uniref:Quinol monooxygenase YgiN n=1 Tax=Jatrophihabitans endophyticus TaxID=1206085 RepID=A0A1M5KJ26_9ACTN|nr:antibiotic biosynthesis monooxygenase [Jatrophihabitans endophyticus]SHG52771.1 hypothetical protein SAMN05443575_2173 [Jatrophihabitans endophyticus]